MNRCSPDASGAAAGLGADGARSGTATVGVPLGDISWLTTPGRVPPADLRTMPLPERTVVFIGVRSGPCTGRPNFPWCSIPGVLPVSSSPIAAATVAIIPDELDMRPGTTGGAVHLWPGGAHGCLQLPRLVPMVDFSPDRGPRWGRRRWAATVADGAKRWAGTAPTRRVDRSRYGRPRRTARGAAPPRPRAGTPRRFGRPRGRRPSSRSRRWCRGRDGRRRPRARRRR